jgi:phosphoserine phosphatase
MDPATPTVLLTVTGRDRPGVTAALFAAIADLPVEVLDIEQVVIRGRLLLGILLTDDGDSSWVPAVTKAVSELELHLDLEHTRGDGHAYSPEAAPLPSLRKQRSHVTVLGLPLLPSALAGVAATIAREGANIERIQRVARYPVTAVELQVHGAEPDALRTALASEAVIHGIDIAVQRAGLHRRAKRLVVMDVDSTLVQGEVVEMLAARAGCEPEVARITESAMRGEIDFEESLRRRVRLLKGLDASALDAVHADLLLMPGARTLIRTLHRLGYRTAIVSGGFTAITDRLAADLGIDHSRANELEIRDGVLTGEVVGQVIDRAAKRTALLEFAEREGIPVAATVAIGDGANDLDMIAAAGLGIAFNAKPVLREAADTSLSVPYLDAILYLLGISREEIESADDDAGVVTRSPAVR